MQQNFFYRIMKTFANEAEFQRFLQQVYASQTYAHSYYVYADCFNEGQDSQLTLLQDLTDEDSANAVCEANRFAVENCGTDYANIYVVNVFDSPFVYQRLTGKAVEKAFELQLIKKEFFAQHCIKAVIIQSEDGKRAVCELGTRTMDVHEAKAEAADYAIWFLGWPSYSVVDYVRHRPIEAVEVCLNSDGSIITVKVTKTYDKQQASDEAREMYGECVVIGVIYAD